MDKKLSIKYKNTDDLIPYAMNSRTHNEQQVGQIAASIKAFGFTNPVLLDGENGIIAGHGRVLAAQKLALQQVPTIELSHFNENQKRAYVIVDNKLALNAEWDKEFLMSEIKTLESEKFDLSLLGFQPYEISDLSNELNEDDDEDTDSKEEDELNFTIQYNIVFDHEEQQDDWYSFIKYLKEKYPDAETVAERLQLFLRNNGYVTR